MSCETRSNEYKCRLTEKTNAYFTVLNYRIYGIDESLQSFCLLIIDLLDNGLTLTKRKNMKLYINSSQIEHRKGQV